MKNKKILFISAGVTVVTVLIVVLASTVTYAAYDRAYENRIFPGVQILGISVGGLTVADASQHVTRVLDQKLGQGVRFRYPGQEVKIDLQGNADPDASHDVVTYGVSDALRSAYLEGRDGAVIQQALMRLRMRTYPITIPIQVGVDRETVAQELSLALKGKLIEMQNARFEIDPLAIPPLVTVKPEQKGTVVLTDQALDVFVRRVSALDFSPIELSARAENPQIRAQDLEPLLPRVQELLTRPAPIFTYQNHSYPVTMAQVANWISVTGTVPNLVVAFDQDALSTDLAQIVPGVEQEAKNGSLTTKDGKVVSLVPGQAGVAIDHAALIDALTNLWPTTSTLPLVVHETESKLTGEDPERLGIKDLLGVGTSDFSGSPSNRRKNIAHGAALVNGTVIQPGEIFSLLKTLGPVDGKHNWLPELVIKGNVTKPEFGGGLCQIGTTTFRGAMSAGLPIVERQNHSYRVRYYEPAGTDATIYDPAPDFRFLNDTATPVLINAYLKGDLVVFEFWGTRDGRKAEQTKPHIYKIVSPPPMKIVETLDLPVGKKKCTETAHAGADADFTYTVTYASGDVKIVPFHSHYKPWQAVCAVGVAALSTGSASSTSTSAIPVTP